jgi:hypothetical protein
VQRNPELPQGAGVPGGRQWGDTRPESESGSLVYQLAMDRGFRRGLLDRFPVSIFTAAALAVDHNGRFRACGMRGALGGLHDYGFDIRRALESEAMRDEVDAIPKANFWCTHRCFIQKSSKLSAKAQLLGIPWAGISSS